jgi:aldose sugar dehydrogenase
MGPEGGDEFNLIERGQNYGWPNASNGSDYGGSDIPDHRPGGGYAAPAVSWTPVIAPAGLVIYSGLAFSAWRGDAISVGLVSAACACG